MHDAESYTTDQFCYKTYSQSVQLRDRLSRNTDTIQLKSINSAHRRWHDGWFEIQIVNKKISFRTNFFFI